MAASADVQECNGEAPGVWTTVTAAKFCTKDMHNPGTTYPIPIQAAATNYSFWKSHCLLFGGEFTEITNIKIYTDGVGFGTGITVNVGDETLAAASYVQATGTDGDTGTEMVTGHSGITAKTDFFTYTSEAAKDVDAGPISEAGKSKHVVLQMDVIDTATPGELDTEEITWQYDEV
ncbi:hypothetical protein ES703_43845 [subsurface metagenome]